LIASPAEEVVMPDKSSQPPKNPLFDAVFGAASAHAKNTIAKSEEAERVAHLKALLPSLLKKGSARPRIEQFLPYLLLRSYVGDHGGRPFTGDVDGNGQLTPGASGSMANSPDIWHAPGDPSAAPEIPANRGGSEAASGPCTIYAHVWNLGRAPIFGAAVEFHLAGPIGDVAESAAQTQLLGTVRTDLGPRSSPECHRLVKCPNAWVYKSGAVSGFVNLIVRVSCVGDSVGSAHPWSPNNNRHVSMRVVYKAG
jgi:hypothetical protein